jgi:hypothetical protein
MENPLPVPDWLLRELFLNNGIFNDEKTAVISGIEAPSPFTIDLTQRSDWQAIQKRLAEEGF